MLKKTAKVLAFFILLTPMVILAFAAFTLISFLFGVSPEDIP